MSEQYKEPESEETMVESDLLEGIVREVRDLVLDKGLGEERAFAEVSRKKRLHLGRTEDQMSELKEAVTDQLLKDSIAKHANRGGKVRAIEPSVAPVIVTPRVERPAVARPRRSSSHPMFKPDDGPDYRERQLPTGDL